MLPLNFFILVCLMQIWMAATWRTHSVPGFPRPWMAIPATRRPYESPDWHNTIWSTPTPTRFSSVLVTRTGNSMPINISSSTFLSTPTPVIVPSNNSSKLTTRVQTDATFSSSFQPSSTLPGSSGLPATLSVQSNATIISVFQSSSIVQSSSGIPTLSIKPNATRSRGFQPSSTVQSSSGLPTNLSPNDKYRTYLGDGSVQDGWPAMDQWVDFTFMFDYNKANMKASCAQWGVPSDTAQEINEMRQAIISISGLTKIDARFILAVTIQESTGCVRVITTEYSHPNPGLMQSYNGTGSCNSNSPAVGLSGDVLYPCPQAEIYQQILDGTNGTAWGPGLRQNYAQQGHTDVSGYYRTARLYNGGKLSADGNLEGPCCTPSYASDIANRLTGWAYAPHTFNS